MRQSLTISSNTVLFFFSLLLIEYFTLYHKYRERKKNSNDSSQLEGYQNGLAGTITKKKKCEPIQRKTCFVAREFFLFFNLLSGCRSEFFFYDVVSSSWMWNRFHNNVTNITVYLFIILFYIDLFLNFPISPDIIYLFLVHQTYHLPYFLPFRWW